MIEIHQKLGGELRFQVFSKEDLDEKGDPKAGVTPKLDTGFNKQIITDSYFESYVGGSTLYPLNAFLYLGVGTGTAAATASDTTITQIGARVGGNIGTNPLSSGSISGNEITQTLEYRFTQGAIIGTITEVGIFQNISGGNCFMRSLIKDVGGTPTSLTLTSIDFLYVTWRVKTIVDLSDKTGTITLGGVNYNYTLRPINWTSNGVNPSTGTNIFGALTNSSAQTNFGMLVARAYNTQTLVATSGASPTSSENDLTSTKTQVVYAASSKQRKVSWVFNTSQANLTGGVGLVVFANNIGVEMGYQVSFSAVSGGGRIPKDNTKTLTLSLTFTFGR